MTEQVDQRELRIDTERIVRAVDEGQTFLITRNGRPVGELRPLRRDHFVDAETVAEAFRHAPRLDWKEIREELDQVVDQAIEPRA